MKTCRRSSESKTFCSCVHCFSVVNVCNNACNQLIWHTHCDWICWLRLCDKHENLLVNCCHFFLPLCEYISKQILHYCKWWWKMWHFSVKSFLFRILNGKLTENRYCCLSIHKCFFPWWISMLHVPWPRYRFGLVSWPTLPPQKKTPQKEFKMLHLLCLFVYSHCV